MHRWNLCLQPRIQRCVNYYVISRPGFGASEATESSERHALIVSASSSLTAKIISFYIHPTTILATVQ